MRNFGWCLNSIYLFGLTIYILLIFLFMLLNNEIINPGDKDQVFRVFKSIEVILIIILLCLELSNIYINCISHKNRPTRIKVSMLKNFEFIVLVAIFIIDIPALSTEPITFVHLEKSLNYLLRLWYFGLKVCLKIKHRVLILLL